MLGLINGLLVYAFGHDIDFDQMRPIEKDSAENKTSDK